MILLGPKLLFARSDFKAYSLTLIVKIGYVHMVAIVLAIKLAINSNLVDY